MTLLEHPLSNGDLEWETLDRLEAVVLAFRHLTMTGQSLDGRESAALAAERYGRAMAALTLVLARLREDSRRQVVAGLRAQRLHEMLAGPAGPNAVGMTDEAENAGASDERMSGAPAREAIGMPAGSESPQPSAKRMGDAAIPLGTAAGSEIARASDERMDEPPIRTELGTAAGSEIARASDERMAAGTPNPRKRGAQPGNRNALKHGQRCAAIRDARARVRAALGRVKDLRAQADALIAEADGRPLRIAGRL